MRENHDHATERFYSSNAVAYAAQTLTANIEYLYKPFLDHVPAGGHILDAGSGSGRDTAFFLRQGFQVTAFDASDAMAKISTELTRQDTLVLRFEQVNWMETFDGIWAQASLLHVPKAGIVKAISSLLRTLKTGGVFYASFKLGEGERFDGQRFFNDYTERSLRELIARFPELQLHTT
jgi:SAM-dependent methyltransferase